MISYNKNILKQFLDAVGSKNIGEIPITQELLTELKEWIKYRKKIGREYTLFLEELGLDDIKTSYVAEIGKGTLDSVVKPFNTTIISPYTFDIKDKSRCIRGELLIKNGEPFIESRTYEDEKKYKTLRDSGFTFMTQNPYTPDKIKNWEYLHNNGFNIIAGMYGNIYDKDFDLKLKLLKMLRTKLENDVITESIVNQDYYAVVVATDKKSLKKILTYTHEYNTEKEDYDIQLSLTR